MKIGVVGAGIQGSACVEILAREKDIEKITVIDSSADHLNAVLAGNPSSEVECHICDIRDSLSAKAFLQGCDVIFDMLIPEFTEDVMNLALNLRAHYINTAYDHPFWECIAGGRELPFDREFKNAGLTAMLGCGDSPGLVNVFVRKYCDLFDAVDAVRIFGAYKNPKADDGRTWDPGWSRKQAYLDFITLPVIFRDGRYVQKEQFSETETVSFPDYGARQLALHSHEEAYSIPRIIGKQIRNCEFRYEVDPYAFRLFHEGYTKDTYVNENGQRICLLDRLFEKFDTMKSGPSDDGDEYTSIIEISGSAKGRAGFVRVILPPLYRDRNLAMKLFQTVKIDVALPAAVFMRCMAGMTPGIHFAEEVSPALFQEILQNYIPYRETVFRTGDAGNLNALKKAAGTSDDLYLPSLYSGPLSH